MAGNAEMNIASNLIKPQPNFRISGVSVTLHHTNFIHSSLNIRKDFHACVLNKRLAVEAQIYVATAHASQNKPPRAINCKQSLIPSNLRPFGPVYCPMIDLGLSQLIAKARNRKFQSQTFASINFISSSILGQCDHIIFASWPRIAVEA